MFFFIFIEWSWSVHLPLLRFHEIMPKTTDTHTRIILNYTEAYF